MSWIHAIPPMARVPRVLRRPLAGREEESHAMCPDNVVDAAIGGDHERAVALPGDGTKPWPAFTGSAPVDLLVEAVADRPARVRVETARCHSRLSSGLGGGDGTSRRRIVM